MKVFEIRDSFPDPANSKLLGYLFYYEAKNSFHTELLKGLDEWEAPFIFQKSIHDGRYSIGSSLSVKFVLQRIVPRERQNLGEILRTNRLRGYDECRLLTMSEGRCAQDDLFLVKIEEDLIEPEIKERMQKKIKEAIPLSSGRVLVFFIDGKSRIVDIKENNSEDLMIERVLKYKELFERLHITPGGNDIQWATGRGFSAEEMYEAGEETNIKLEDMVDFVTNRLVDTTEATKILGCSRQYINQMVKEGRITPLRSESNNRLFLLSEIEAL